MTLEEARRMKELFLARLRKEANGDEEEELPKKPLPAGADAKIKALFAQSPKPSDDEVHDLAEELGVHPSVLEARIYSMLGEKMKTAQKHEHVPDENFDQKQLQMGIKVEKEHTDDPEKAKEIAKDHLSEMPDYYTRLKKMEEEGMDGAKKQAYYNEAGEIAWDLVEDAYADEHMKLAGYSDEEIEKLRGIYQRAREIRKNQEKPIESLEKFIDGASPKVMDRPVNPLGLGDDCRWPRFRDLQDKAKIKPYQKLLDEEMAIHKGKDRADISGAVRWVRETAFMNKAPAIPATPGKAPTD